MQGLIDDDINIKIEASWLYSNIGRKGNGKDVILLVEMKICEYIAEALKERNVHFMGNILSLIHFIMIAATSTNKPEIFRTLIETGCYNALTTAEFIADKKVSSKIANLLYELEKHLDDE